MLTGGGKHFSGEETQLGMVLIPKHWLTARFSSLSLTLTNRVGLTGFGQRPDPGLIVEAEQVHGPDVAVATRDKVQRRLKGVDALVTQTKGIWLAVRVADCIPLFLFDRQLEVVGVAHVGWRGLWRGIINHFLNQAQTLKETPLEDFFAVLGPSVGGCCYPVGPEVANRFQKQSSQTPGLLIPGPSGQKLDLRLACRLALEKHGLDQKRIWAPPTCTVCQKDFYSYRRSKGKLTGWNQALIGISTGSEG